MKRLDPQPSCHCCQDLQQQDEFAMYRNNRHNHRRRGSRSTAACMSLVTFLSLFLSVDSFLPALTSTSLSTWPSSISTTWSKPYRHHRSSCLHYTVQETDATASEWESLFSFPKQTERSTATTTARSSSSSSVRSDTATATTTTAGVTRPEFPSSNTQLQSVQSTAPAILLKSGPGTGKSYALASRIAHLLRTRSCRPEHMVVLSFTNRDANTLKKRALQMLFPELPTAGGQAQGQCIIKNHSLSKAEVQERLWSGTIHAFAKSLLQAAAPKTSTATSPLNRVIGSKEMRMRADKCLHKMMERTESPRIQTIRLLHKDALEDVFQSRGQMLHQVCRCIEMWKEGGLVRPPFVPGSTTEQEKVKNIKNIKAFAIMEPQVRDDCVEIAMRLGIAQSVALLALEIIPDYQAFHAKLGTADPADLASMAYYLLLSDSHTLNAMRVKLKHVVLDEYQDVSVAQHGLLRLLIRGLVDEEDTGVISSVSKYGRKESPSVPPILPSYVPAASRNKGTVCFDVPKLFCAGDSNQSIYGWRGAAPSLSVEGFQSDYPQGVIVPLETSYRLPRNIWNAAIALVGPDEKGSMASGDTDTVTFLTSPIVAEKRRHSAALNSQDESLSVLFSESLESNEPASTLQIKGLWDAREEAKFIARIIRKRSKERMTRFQNVMKKMNTDKTDESQNSAMSSISDPTEVAIIFRSTAEMELMKQALQNAGLPYKSADSDNDGQVASSSSQAASTARGGKAQLLAMKPVVLMTMHRAKGEEYDDVYLAGWTEGVFPHPTAVSMNRVHEERRLAYVAITRARQQVYITHSYIRRNLHHGPDLKKKYVTEQVEPSRFLYELVPDDQETDIICRESSDGLPDIVWDRNAGCKESVAGRDLPDYYAKSYSAPAGYVERYTNGDRKIKESLEKHVKAKPTIGQRLDNTPQTPPATVRAVPDSRLAPDAEIKVPEVLTKARNTDTTVATQPNLNSTKDITLSNASEKKLSDRERKLLEVIERGLSDMRQKRGYNKKYHHLFRRSLKDIFGIGSGTALVLPPGIDPKNVPIDALLHASKSSLTKRHLSRCTAPQLGLWLAYLALGGGLQ